VAELATRVAERFPRTVVGASLRASLPTLRRSAGLCPRCSAPYKGIADACPKCLAAAATAAAAGTAAATAAPGPAPEAAPGVEAEPEAEGTPAEESPFEADLDGV
jgi:hypothetical protein